MNNRPLVLAVASCGGHWVQLKKIAPALGAFDVLYVTTSAEVLELDSSVVCVRDCYMSTPLKAALCFIQLLRVTARRRPTFIVTTGAAPGALAILAGWLFGAKGIWIESAANSDRVSISGRLIAPFTEVCLTQWEHLSDDKFKFRGSVL